MYNESEYLNILSFGNELATVICDGGNSWFKLITDTPALRGSNRTNFVMFEHAIVEVDEATFRNRLHYHKGKKGYHLIEWRGRYFIVGAEAYSVNPGFEPTNGRAKYARDYYGLLFVRGLLELFDGVIPAEINAFLAHPPADLDHTDALMKSVHGNWSFKANGKPHTTRVIYSNVFDEIVGGVHNATDGVDGERIEGNALEGNAPALVFDLGGGSLDLAYLKKDLSVDYDRGMSSDRIGVNKAVETFKGLFDQRHSKIVSQSEDGISRENVIAIFLDPKHEIWDGGELLKCDDLYKEAFSPIMRQARKAVRDYTGGNFLGIQSILLTGGGTSILLDRILDEIFPKFKEMNKVFKTDKPIRMIESNARGGLKIVEAMRRSGKANAAHYLKVAG